MSTLLQPRSSLSSADRTSFSSRLVRWLSAHQRFCLTLTVSIFSLCAIYEAIVRPVWFDEFFTYSISRLSSLHDMLKAMPADGHPPLQYLVTHLSLRLFGFSELSLRLPEILAYIVSGLVLWQIVRKHGTPVQALFAVTVLMGATTRSYLLNGPSVRGLAYTARPYQLVILFTCLAFLCWQRATLTEGTRRLLPLAGLSLSLAGAILSHHYGLIQIGAFLAAGEITRMVRRRRIDWSLVAAVCLGLLPLIVTLPLIAQTRNLLDKPVLQSTNMWAKPGFAELYTWPAMVPWLIFLPLTVLACLPARRTAEPASTPELPPVPRHEIAAAIALALLPPAEILLAIATTGYYFPRYAVGGCLGLALLFTWTWPRVGYLRSVAQPALAWLTVAYLALTTIWLADSQLTHPLQRDQARVAGASPLLVHAPTGLPIVAASAYDYFSQWWYAPPAAQHRLLYLTDLPYALQTPRFMAELSLVSDRAWLPFPTVDYSPFLAQHSRFLVLCTGEEQDNWLTPRLLHSGWHLTLLDRSGGDSLYEAESPAASDPSGVNP